jgi:hypothetical protein
MADELVDKAREVLLRLKEVDSATGLVDRLGEFFPQQTDLAWLTGTSFEDAFAREQQKSPTGEITGGWLDTRQYNQFWGYIRDYSEDTGPGQFATFLEGLLAGWEDAAATAYQLPESAPPVGTPRFQAVEQVEGYPGWWQGYDSVDRVWKYVWTAGAVPDDQTYGWTISLQSSGEQPATQEERAKSVYALVLAEVIEPTAEELELIWSGVWAKVTATDASAAGWNSGSAAEIADEVANDHFGRILQEGEEVDAAELITEIQAIRALLIQHARS